MPGRLEPKWEEGVYVGFVIRTGEDLVSTPNGVFRVSTVRRRPADERWSKQLLDGIVGTPAIPVPGVAGRKVPTYAKKFSTTAPEKKPSDFMPPEEAEAPRARTWKILKEDIMGTHMGSGRHQAAQDVELSKEASVGKLATHLSAASESKDT